jgi:hypothetical protein
VSPVTPMCSGLLVWDRVCVVRAGVGAVEER